MGSIPTWPLLPLSAFSGPRQQECGGRVPAIGILAEWLRRLIRNQLGTFPREFESLRCRIFIFFRKITKIAEISRIFSFFFRIFFIF